MTFLLKPKVPELYFVRAMPIVLHKGSCHCGAVQFEVEAPEDLTVYNCNCSICYIKANTHFVVPASRFKLVQGHDNLSTYTFNTHVAKHMFCKTCGVQSFYHPRSNPDGIGVNPRCIKPGTVKSVTSVSYDGVNWEKSFEEEKLKPNSIQSKSKDGPS